MGSSALLNLLQEDFLFRLYLLLSQLLKMQMFSSLSMLLLRKLTTMKSQPPASLQSLKKLMNFPAHQPHFSETPPQSFLQELLKQHNLSSINNYLRTPSCPHSWCSIPTARYQQCCKI